MGSNVTSDSEYTPSEATETRYRRSERLRVKAIAKKSYENKDDSQMDSESSSYTETESYISDDGNYEEDDVYVETKRKSSKNITKPNPKKTKVDRELNNPAEQYYDNDHELFYNKMTYKDKQLVTEKEKQVFKSIAGNKPVRFRVLDSKLDTDGKCLILQKLAPLLRDNPLCSETPKLQKWADIVLDIPFGILKHPLVTNKSGVDEIRRHIALIESRLEENVYGHSETKKQIVRLIAKWIANPSSSGNVIGLYGPPGVGKSSLVKHIGEALGTPTITIPLGGACDGAFLEGHSYVYEGSMPGIIVSSITRAGCMNPVILFDELDKISTSHKGSDITNVLIHVTDPVQNDNFRDKYLGDVGLDLSHAIFVFTFNDIQYVHPVLLDRMIRIETKPYTTTDKFAIATKHLLPKICRDHGLVDRDVRVSDSVFRDIISAIECESGVRNLGRALEAIVSKVSFDLLIGNENTYGESGDIYITPKMIKDSIKTKHTSASVAHMYL